MAYKILVLKGDGIGPEVVGEALQVLKIVARNAALDLEFKEGVDRRACDRSIRHAACPTTCSSRRKTATRFCLARSAAPSGTTPRPTSVPSRRCSTLRKELGLFANVRPVKAVKELTATSPLRQEIINGVDLVVIRELTGGIYYGKPTERRNNGDLRESRRHLRLLRGRDRPRAALRL